MRVTGVYLRETGHNPAFDTEFSGLPSLFSINEHYSYRKGSNAYEASPQPLHVFFPCEKPHRLQGRVAHPHLQPAPFSSHPLSEIFSHIPYTRVVEQEG